MKFRTLFILILSAMLVSACSMLEGANQSLNYVNQTADYMTKLSDFAEKAPQMIKDAASNPETKQQLEQKLIALKKEIEQFNLANAPAIAKDIHQQLKEKNQVLLQEINKVVDNGHLALDKLQNSQVVTTISDIMGLINRINNLGL